MHRAKSFFYVAAGICLLALSYHLGARNAMAQAPGNPLVAVGPWPGGGGIMAATANGDLYYATGGSPLTFTLQANVFNGPTPVQQETWGAMKSRYRGERGAAQPAPQGR